MTDETKETTTKTPPSDRELLARVKALCDRVLNDPAYESPDGNDLALDIIRVLADAPGYPPFGFDAYQQEALVTARDKEGPMALSVGGMGLGGEAAEFLELHLTQHERFLEAVRVMVSAGKTVDYLKKVVHHDHPLDRERVKKELGDLLWYVAITANACQLPLSTVADSNIQKLRERYRKNFSVAESLNRKATDS